MRISDESHESILCEIRRREKLGWLRQLKKIQRMMRMMKVELENVAGHQQKAGVKRASGFSESHFCEKNTQ